MNSRTRFIAGLVALAAMVASITETAVAAACAPMGAMDSAIMPSMSGMGDEDGDRCDDCPPAGEREQDDHPEAPDCPFGLAGAGYGCSPAAMKPSTCAADVATTSHVGLLPSSDVRPPLLWAAALFRPPRA